MAPSVERLVITDLAQWRRTVAALLLPLDITTADGGFRAVIEAVEVSGIRLFTVDAGPHRVERTQRLAQAGRDPFYSISLQLTGSSTVSQNGRDALLGPGDFAVYDSTAPYGRAFDGDSRTLVVMFPQQMISLPPRALAEIAGLRISGDSGMGAIVSAFLRGVADNLAALAGPLGLTTASALVDLVTAAFAERMGIAARGHARLEQLMAIRAGIMERLGDPDLSPSTIAAAHFVSTRQLHVLFSEQGTTVSAWIRERRLEMARRDLADPLRGDEPIGVVAARWGFGDQRHFSALFRRAYGASPAAFRRAVAPQA